MKDPKQIEFETYCNTRSWNIKPITVDKTKTPDFFILDDTGVAIAVAELKVLSKCTLDMQIKRSIINLLHKEVAAPITVKNTSLNQIRNIIKDANRQFKVFDSVLPNLLVLYNERISTDIDSILIERAMNGDTFLLTNKDIGIIAIRHKSKTIGKNWNSHVGAILTPNQRNGMLMIPNKWATKQIERKKFQGQDDDWEAVQ